MAILVLSKTTGFQKTEVEKDGKVFIRIEKIEDLIPSADARLLKCAFICCRNPDEEDDDSYDPAGYFPVRFLGAKWFKESEQLTKDFYIAATFNDKFNEPLFAFGIWGYALYVILFPGLYSMWHISQAYRATMRLYEGRKRRLEHVLGEKRTRELIE